MFRIVKQRNFRLLWCSQIISVLGDRLLGIALPFYIYDMTHSTAALGLMVVAQNVPGLLFGSLAGVFVDRWDTRQVLITVDVARAVLLLPMLVAATESTLWVVYAVTCVQASIGQFFGPAKTALIPHLMDQRDLPATNALTALTDSSTSVIGPAIGGALFVWFGLPCAVWSDAASFGFSALLLAFMHSPATPSPHKANRAHPALRSYGHTMWRDWRDGLRVVCHDHTLSRLFVILGCIALGGGIVSTLVVPFVTTILHGTAQDRGWMSVGQGLGGMGGGALYGMLHSRLKAKWLLASSLCGGGIIYILDFTIPNLFFVLTTMLPFGAIAAIFVITEQTLLQQASPQRYRGRIAGAYGNTGAVLTLLGTVCASSIGNDQVIVPVLCSAGILLIGASVVALRLPVVAIPAHVGVSAPL